MEDTSTPLYNAGVVPSTLVMTDDNTLSTSAMELVYSQHLGGNSLYTVRTNKNLIFLNLFLRTTLIRCGPLW